MSENNLMGYEKRYNAVYNYLDTHKALKNILLYWAKWLREEQRFAVGKGDAAVENEVSRIARRSIEKNH